MRSILKKFSMNKENNKFFYYSLNFARQFVPKQFFQRQLNRKLKHLNKFDSDYISYRVNYYNKLDSQHIFPNNIKTRESFKFRKKHKSYFFDTFEYSGYHPNQLKKDFSFSEISAVPPIPSVAKSRPIAENNDYAVLIRCTQEQDCTTAPKDTKSFLNKKDILFGHLNEKQAQGLRFLKMYFDHPLCDIGHISKSENESKYKYLTKNKTIEEQLDHKFILCLEEQNSTSNLNWIMASNSVAVMPRPKFETWLMEGTLIPNKHYIEIKDDYSDLEEKIKYYIKHSEKALDIIKNANEHVAQFKNKKRENLISLLVLEKYCYITDQKVLNSSVEKVFNNKETAV